MSDIETQYYERGGKLFRTQGTQEHRFDALTKSWVDVRPGISDWLFALDTDLNEVDEAGAKKVAPEAF